MAKNKFDFSKSPYHDDYDENDKFYKVLYRPGKAVQARELNTTQAILQNQISKVGEYSFSHGDQLQGGEVEIFTNREYVKMADIGTHVHTDFRDRIIKKQLLFTLHQLRMLILFHFLFLILILVVPMEMSLLLKVGRPLLIQMVLV